MLINTEDLYYIHPLMLGRNIFKAMALFKKLYLSAGKKTEDDLMNTKAEDVVSVFTALRA